MRLIVFGSILSPRVEFNKHGRGMQLSKPTVDTYDTNNGMCSSIWQCKLIPLRVTVLVYCILLNYWELHLTATLGYVTQRKHQH